MRSMFVKLFFWFWSITILAGGICFVLAFNLRLSPLHAGRMRHFEEERRQLVESALSLYGASAASLRERGLPPAPAGGGGELRAYLFAADGAPLSPGVPEQLRSAVRAFAAGGPGAPPEHFPDVVVTPVSSPSGTRYLAAAAGVNPMPHPPPLRGFPFPPDFWLNFSITLLISGLLCYLLAWRLTVPIRHLRAAAQSLARGELAARVDVPDEKEGGELADLGRDFNRMAERIGKLVASHRQLLRDVSHELRSPLARLGVALGLARLNASPQVEAALDRIEQEAHRLNLLIGELLALSRLEGESGGVEFSEVELAPLVEDVVRDADFEAQSAGRRVLVRSAPPVRLRGNRELLRRALENVVRNAIRYTEMGSAVEVSLLEGGAEVTILVRDHGPGVPEALLADIFRPFFRVAEARDRKSGGTGIGLAISNGTVTLHGGSIKARNAAGGGLEVEIRLPLASR